MDKKDAFRILNVHPDTHTYSQAKDNFRFLAKKHHPDKNGDEEVFKKINNAWDLCKQHFPKAPKHLLPIAYFRKNKRGFLRWTSFDFLSSEGSAYLIWVSYRKEGNKYICEDEILKQKIPQNERLIIDGVTHNIKEDFPNFENFSRPLRIKEISPGEFHNI